MPVESITPEQAPEYFGWLANLAQIDVAASSALTRQQLGWNFTGPLRTPPAMAAGVTDRLWSVEDLVALWEAYEQRRREDK
jgi:hypothetical protein